MRPSVLVIAMVCIVAACSSHRPDYDTARTRPPKPTTTEPMAEAAAQRMDAATAPSPPASGAAGIATHLIKQRAAAAYGLVPAPPSWISSQPRNTEHYAARTDNPVQRTTEHPVSTFSIDVDTGSYANVRRMLRAGIRPPADAVRAEEFLNYFTYHHPAPSSPKTPFRVSTELAPAPWNGKRHLLMIGLKGYDIPKATLPASNLVLLVDTSGSMTAPDKLPLLKQALKQLIPHLRAQDRVSIVTYAGSARVVLPATPGDRHGDIMAAIDMLQASGGTNGGSGIELAYAMARQAFIPRGGNRVLLATDGDFNVGISDQAALETLVADQRKHGIALSTLGLGSGNYNDAMAERLADVGDGQHAYIDTVLEARKVLVTQMQSTLLTIARDVKIQIEFNPAQVSEYRLIGYENRLLQREDFNNDRVDAGDIGAGHEVTALYELTLAGSDADQIPALRYTAPVDTHSAHSATGPGGGTGLRDQEIAHLRLRYKLPGQDNSALIQTPVLRTQARARPSDTLQFAAAVAAYADALRGGARITWSWDAISAAAQRTRGHDRWGLRAEFTQLVDAARISTGHAPAAASADVQQHRHAN